MKKIILLFMLQPVALNVLFAQNVGVGTTNPTEKLEVNGAVKLGNTTSTYTPGTVKYDGSQLKGNEAGAWKSLVNTGTTLSFPLFTSNVRNQEVATTDSFVVTDAGQYMIIMTSYMANSENYSGTVYDTQGYIYLYDKANRVLSHHAATNNFESYTGGYTFSMVPAEWPEIGLAYFSANDVIKATAIYNSYGTPVPTSNWSFYMNLILVKLQ